MTKAKEREWTYLPEIIHFVSPDKPTITLCKKVIKDKARKRTDQKEKVTCSHCYNRLKSPTKPGFTFKQSLRPFRF